MENISFYLGIVCGTICVIMFGSPLSTIKTVLETKSTESMPFLMCVMGFACSFSWMVYGSLINDYFVLIPNLGGFLVGSIQMLLFVAFRKSKMSTFN